MEGKQTVMTGYKPFCGQKKDWGRASGSLSKRGEACHGQKGRPDGADEEVRGGRQENEARGEAMLG